MLFKQKRSQKGTRFKRGGSQKGDGTSRKKRTLLPGRRGVGRVNRKTSFKRGGSADGEKNIKKPGCPSLGAQADAKKKRPLPGKYDHGVANFIYDSKNLIPRMT